jgi:serine/threonine protein kinase
MTDVQSREESLLGDRYVLEGLIGRGGMADVYRAHDQVLRRSVAVKLLRSLAVTEAERARFTVEARTLARLDHPGLVTILDAATTDDQPYLVMELIHGRSLAEYCSGAALEPARVAAIGEQLADALGHAHAAGVVHRDLKPGNVLIGADDRATLTDFGIARLMSETTRHTTTGATVGTAAYLAPEQVCGEAITPASDVYSLGLVLLEALTGERAYRGLPIEAALARLTTPPTIPDTVPSHWHTLLRAMTALVPVERPSTEEVAASLRDLASGLDPVTATGLFRVESVRSDALIAPAVGAMHSGETIGTFRLEPEMQPRSNRIVDDWRWMVGAGFASLLLLLVGASVTSGDDGEVSALPVNAPSRPKTTITDRQSSQLNAELPGASWLQHPARYRPRRSWNPVRFFPGETPDVVPEREDDGSQPTDLQDEQVLDDSREDVEKQRETETQKRNELEKKREEKQRQGRGTADSSVNGPSLARGA